MAVAKRIVSAGKSAHGQQVKLAMVGYSFGGGAIFDITTNMKKGLNGFPAWPTNVSLVETTYIDGIKDGFIGALPTQPVKVLKGQILDAVTGRPDSNIHYSYYQSGLEPLTDPADLPHGKATNPDATGRPTTSVDLDVAGSETGWLRATPHNLPTAVTPDKHSIDQDPTLHKKIVQDLQDALK
jgi:hypothetical protein